MRRIQIRILVYRTNDIDSLKLLNQFEIEEARRPLRNREGYLARRFDGHDLLAGIEPVERAIVMRDDLLGFQQIIVESRVPVADQSHME
jgi:hypothetical protein